jgi:hypothetical protein
MRQPAVISESTTIADADIQKWIPAFTQQWNKGLPPVWGVDSAIYSFVPKAQAPAAGALLAVRNVTCSTGEDLRNHIWERQLKRSSFSHEVRASSIGCRFLS